MQMLDGKQDGKQDDQARREPAHTQKGFQAPKSEGVKPSPSMEFEDDIPF